MMILLSVDNAAEKGEYGLPTQLVLVYAWSKAAPAIYHHAGYLYRVPLQSCSPRLAVLWHFVFAGLGVLVR